MDKNLKSLIAAEYAKVYRDGSHMHSYCVNTVSDAVVLSNGWVYLFEKPSIEKDFCFGYRLSSEDSEEYDEANAMADHVKNDAGVYFKAKNLEKFERFAEELTNNDFIAFPNYRGESNICAVMTEDGFNRYYAHEKNNYRLTPEDIENLAKVNASEKAKFEKRLDTYLKKYGTSKLHTWSYWSEA